AVHIRNPRSVRPWQHVLEPLAGYLLLAQRLLEGNVACADAWNFGPADEGNVEVAAVVARMHEVWPRVACELASQPHGPHETKVLKLDSSKARAGLGWRPVWDWRAAVRHTASWYEAFYERNTVLSREDLARYLCDGRNLNNGLAQ